MATGGRKPRLYVNMKKRTLLALSLFVSMATFAQPVTYGTAAGIGVYSMRGEAVNNLQQLLEFTDGIVSTKPVTGFYAGGYANIPVSGNVSVEPGLYFTAKGYEVSGSYAVKDISLLSANAHARLNTSYIDMPVLLKVNVNGLQLFAGPQLSYLTNAKLNTNLAVAGFNLLKSSSDVTKQFNRWDAGVTGGVGYQFSNGIRINAIYELGLSKTDAVKSTQSYNQGFKIGAAFSF